MEEDAVGVFSTFGDSPVACPGGELAEYGNSILLPHLSRHVSTLLCCSADSPSSPWPAAEEEFGTPSKCLITLRNKVIRAAELVGT